MVRKKMKPIYFAVNQRDPMVVQTVKPFGTFVKEVLQMSEREPMQPATVEAHNRRNDCNPAIAHEMVDEVDKRLREVEALVKGAKGKSASTRDVEPSLVEQWFNQL
ncbi:hypothetical protein Bca52824_023426 [Brassica carinata]|uniref:Uncharacterized protein n=1 Tax=Brassica carinata TaxID=52824 RepID=A0A8X7VIG3_BRACI|nr:hypothetical protein Bca52824_023426 [Brassica carinata]